ncbi:hydroxysqualene dehydroxylase HpnE [Granulicella cerasi]|uniref:Hydroxysqualene dehydroxylase HpnE n=1 Tax=Granulicella cerasi TaxID=741063 RepID=A0ABW1Z4R2_9BACT|nr:hydroxysqualene dehydroxylase HpnE [Granulicella cerasi]
MSAVVDVAVLGAGVAGLATAIDLASAGLSTVVLERKPFVGGRAYSYDHPALQEVVDSQHVLLGCCVNLVDLSQRSGAAEHLRWYDEIPFLEPGGRRSVLRAGTSPKASLGFLRAPMLGWKDKIAVARGLREFFAGYPQRDDESFAQWLKRTRQTPLAIRHFWEPIVIATLNDGFERCSMRYAGQVFHEAFVKSAEGGRMGIPTLPLSEYYAHFATYAESLGADLQLRASVDRIERIGGIWSAFAGEKAVRAKNLVLALPFEQTAKLLDVPHIGEFTHAPITTIHLWFDREVCDVEQCALLDTRIQWLFNKSRIRGNAGAEQYLELVISGSFAELKMQREEILHGALRELAQFFPKVLAAKLLKSGVLKEARATFSVTPGLDAFRPDTSAPGEGLYLAGDWTATGWPSTMEGAARSGRLAASAILGRSCLAPELKADGLARLFVRD